VVYLLSKVAAHIISPRANTVFHYDLSTEGSKRFGSAWAGALTKLRRVNPPTGIELETNTYGEYWYAAYRKKELYAYVVSREPIIEFNAMNLIQKFLLVAKMLFSDPRFRLGEVDGEQVGQVGTPSFSFFNGGTPVVRVTNVRIKSMGFKTSLKYAEKSGFSTDV